jgi:hypothetical protein
MNAEGSTDIAVRRELLRMALHNSARSVPLQMIAIGFVVWLGIRSDAMARRRPPARSAWSSPSGA